ncbi:hypothetical protein SUGI_0259190 [Cryptomeria japonica]|nr:hypothetical protein SUGI_0259190 [Cryptomeria japonica]
MRQQGSASLQKDVTIRELIITLNNSSWQEKWAINPDIAFVCLTSLQPSDSISPALFSRQFSAIGGMVG